MAFKYVTAILTDSPNTEFASPSRSSVHATADAIESLRSFAPGVPLVIVFDGITVPQRRMFGSKSPVRNASEYLKHIERVRSLAIATMLQSVQIIIAPERGRLVGTAHAGVAAVRTPFVLKMQNDRPLQDDCRGKRSCVQCGKNLTMYKLSGFLQKRLMST